MTAFLEVMRRVLRSRRDSFAPALEAGGQARWKMAVQWVAGPSALLVAEDNGQLRLVDLQSKEQIGRTFLCALGPCLGASFAAR
jgi:hypothetical protein